MSGGNYLNRTPGETNAFNALLRQAQALYGLDWDTTNLEAVLPDRFSSIDLGLISRVNNWTSILAPHTLSLKFRYQYCDKLLDQAADLLDRCVKAKTEFDDLRAKGFLLGVELEQYRRTYDLHQLEIASGYYTWPIPRDQQAFEQSISAQNNNLDASTSAWDTVDQLRTTSNDKRKTTASIIAGMEALPQNDSQTAELYWSEDGKTFAHIDQPHANMQRKSDWMQQLSDEQWDENKQLDDQTFVATKGSAEAQNEASKQAVDQASRKNSYDKDDWGPTGYRIRRNAIENWGSETKYHASSSSGGALNYVECMEAVRVRFDRDFIDALQRCVVAAKGLVQLFNYSISLPSPWHELSQEENTSQFGHILSQYLNNVGTSETTGTILNGHLEELLNWTRNAISFMIQFGQLEQNYVLSVSLKTNAREAWAELKATRSQKADIAFILLAEDFATLFGMSQRHVRLRGVTAFAESSESSGQIWRIALQPPKFGSVTYLDELSSPNDYGAKLEQNIPPAILGRVQSRDAIRDPDTAGTQSFYNVSPWSYSAANPWKMWIENNDPDGVTVATLDDLRIDFYIAMRPQQTNT